MLADFKGLSEHYKIDWQQKDCRNTSKLPQYKKQKTGRTRISFNSNEYIQKKKNRIINYLD